MNSNWPRWISASVAKHFQSYYGSTLVLHEGQEATSAIRQSDHFEFRLDGPYIHLDARNQYRINIEVNILCASHMSDDDLWKQQRMVGQIVAGFVNNICIYKLGSGVDDDQTLLGTMSLVTKEREPVTVSHFGKIESDTRLMQSTVEGHYRMILNI